MANPHWFPPTSSQSRDGKPSLVPTEVITVTRWQTFFTGSHRRHHSHAMANPYWFSLTQSRARDGKPLLVSTDMIMDSVLANPPDSQEHLTDTPWRTYLVPKGAFTDF
ncbi:unnamed protein product [Arabis nemorensis]|uniref:Uncharacterized protein n=1 Tax=Arabis nemorensis TaxID=586526 RepID=A0A565B251_9BRAS|nr:unnamed protein product [Arabis nemorensis]